MLSAEGRTLQQIYQETQRLGRQFEEKGVELKIDLPTDLPALLVNEDRIHQVLLNLIGNALQCTPVGGKVPICDQRMKEAVQVVVSDTSTGILPDRLPHLFTCFYRVDKSHSRAVVDSRIGLTIAKYLVEAHGGRISAHR